MARDPPNASNGIQELVTFKVGPDQKLFFVHMNVVCEQSPVFNKALNSKFKEGNSKVVVLEEVEEEVFKIVMHWLYTHQLPRFRKHGSDAEMKQQVIDFGPAKKKMDDKGNFVELMWDYLISNVYVFAHLYDIIPLREDINREFEKRFEFCKADDPQPLLFPSNTTIIRVFNNVPYDKSSLCRTFTRAFAKN